MDVRAPPAIIAAVDQALQEFGKIDILVNCEWPLCQALPSSSVASVGPAPEAEAQFLFV